MLAHSNRYDTGRIAISFFAKPAKRRENIPSLPSRSFAGDSIWQGLADGLRRTQDASTGLWYQVVDKGEQAGNWHDTSGSAMFVYAIQRAVDLGYIPAEQYQPSARSGYHGLLAKAAINADTGLTH